MADIGRPLSHACFEGGLVAIAAAPCVLIFQAILWLRDGYWTPLPISILWSWTGIHMPEVSWSGVQKIIEWFASVPLSAGMAALGCALFWVGTWLPDNSKTAVKG